MRIWDLNPSRLCRQHLLGEHRELHAIWSILKESKKGYRNHPETKRWMNKTAALWLRHRALVREMEQRGYNHKSPLRWVGDHPSGQDVQDRFVNTIEEQIEILRGKGCDCDV
jgi:hypothetical protein